jgi:hypothetical protein
MTCRAGQAREKAPSAIRQRDEASAQKLGWKARHMKLTPDQVELLRQIPDLPEGSRILSGSPPSGCAKVEAAG